MDQGIEKKLSKDKTLPQDKAELSQEISLRREEGMKKHTKPLGSSSRQHERISINHPQQPKPILGIFSWEEFLEYLSEKEKKDLRKLLESKDVEVEIPKSKESKEVRLIIWDDKLWQSIQESRVALVNFAKSYMKNDSFIFNLQRYDLTQPHHLQKYFCRKNKSFNRFIEKLELNSKKHW